MTIFIDPLGGIEMFENELKRLLETLFENDDESLPDDITIMRGHTPLFGALTTCCTYSYTGYNG